MKSTASMRNTVAKLVAGLGDDHELWSFAIIAALYAQQRAHQRGKQGIEAACESFIKNMHAVTPIIGDEDGDENI